MWSPYALPARLPLGGLTTMDAHQSIHQRWVKTSGNVIWLLTLEGTHVFGQGNDIAAHRCHQLVNLEINVTTHGTGSWLARPNMEDIMGKYPSVSGRRTNWHLSP